MRIAAALLPAVIGAVALTAAAQSQPAAPPPAQKAQAASPEPEHIKVQHILIGFVGSVPQKPIKRTMDEAKALAYDLLKRARAGEDFGALVKEFTDDAFPGIYGMSNRGVQPRQGETERTGMVPAFGDTGFPLKVGEIGIADYDANKSPYGWHIVKRTE